MSENDFFQNLSQISWYNQPQIPDWGSSQQVGDQFLSLFQSSLAGMGGFGFENTGAAGSDLSGMIYLLLGALSETDSIQAPHPGWNNFPSLTQSSLAGGLQGYWNNPAPSLVSSVPTGAPVQGPISQESHPGHTALDYSVVEGTPIRTTMDGIVTRVAFDPDGYGKYVVVQNGPYETYYAHLSDALVGVGDRVWFGQRIGLSGNTGNSTGPHLHYEVRHEGAVVDPNPFVSGRRNYFG